MTLEVAVGPQKLVLNQGSSFAVTEQDGQIDWPTDKGVYHSDTRLISTWRIYADDEPWDLLNSGNIAFFAARIFLTNRRLATETGYIAAGTLGLSIGRSLEGGMHEDLDLVNHGATTAQFNLEIAIRSDFADLFEVKSGAVVRRGRVTTSWSRARETLTTTYTNKDFHRRLTVQVRNADAPPVHANGRLSFSIRLEPGSAWHACLLYAFSDNNTTHAAPDACIEECLHSTPARRVADWEAKSLSLSTGNQEFYHFYEQSLEDMGALRLPLEGTDHLEFVPAAGIPWFVGLFGRDSLIVSLQNAIIRPDFPRGSLDVLGRYQARKRDDYRDAEPGKIMHELRTGELAHFKLIPHTPYYGTADATPLYLIVLHNTWRSTGDDELLSRHLSTAEGCLDWIEHYGDRDGDGFQEYQTRSSAGYENQGWKDSGEAVVYPDGSLVKGPKALCELQGYVYDAWRRMAEIYDALGNTQRANELRTKASTLFRRFNEVFWDEESGFYAFCLDGDKKPVLSVASNPGHCLWSGIVPRERAARVVKRLMADDMWSGWGIRTLSSKHPAFNPQSYQNGSVWPHDNGVIALGCRRYGLTEEAAMIARDVSRAASYFKQHRMPELYAGRQREPTNFPVQYIGANVPQAWAAGSCFSLLQALLGFQPDAPAGKLYLDPALPDWMPDLYLENLHLGRRSFDIRFVRQADGKTTWEVLRGDRDAVSQRSVATYGGEEAAPVKSSAPARSPTRRPEPPTVLVIMGVSGAGKTTIGRALARRLDWPFQEGDDLHPAANIEKMKSGHPLSDADRAPWLAKVEQWITAQLASGRSAVIACSALKRKYREAIVGGRQSVIPVYLKGSKEVVARRLATRRGHFMPPSLMGSQFADLQAPESSEAPIVVDIDQPVAAQVKDILEALRRRDLAI